MESDTLSDALKGIADAKSIGHAGYRVPRFLRTALTETRQKTCDEPQKSEESMQERRVRRNWPCIRYLGFVIDPALPPADTLTHALVNLEDAADDWYVIPLSPDRQLRETKASVPRYFQTVFVAAVHALLKYGEQQELKPNTVVMTRSVPQYARMAADLRN